MRKKGRKKEKTEQQGDFRYAAGDAKVPWHAVGESFSRKDTLEVIKFLLPQKEGATGYDKCLRDIGRGLSALAGMSHPATKLTLGSWIERAETMAKKSLKVKHACFLANWTSGMEIGYKLAGLRPGDEVILPSNTFVATMAYPLAIGAKVVFADIDPGNLNMDPEDLKRKITRRTRVIVPVHIGGYACDMDKIMRLARKHNIYVMEDAAHGLGATYKGKHLGTIGHFGGYSFHEVKNINSFGEGGLLVTNLSCGKQFARARFLGLDFTRTIPNWLYDVTPLADRFGGPQVAGNCSASELQGLGFCLQFARLQKIVEKRRKAAYTLNEVFADEPGILLPPKDTKTTRSCHHLYPLRIDPEVVGADIQALKAKLKEKGVTEVAHFGPMYKFDLMAQLGYDREAIARTCPNTEVSFNRCFTHLPLYPLTKAQIRYMANAVVKSVRELRGVK